MKNYREYMNRQMPSPELLGRLRELEIRPRHVRPWMAWGTAAACCAFVVTLWFLAPGLGQPQTAGPGQSPGPAVGENMEEEKIQEEEILKGPVPTPPEITYQDRSGMMEMDASIALPDGSYQVDLQEEEIRTIFNSTEPEKAVFPKEEWDWTQALGWEDYTLTGRATYDGEGRLFWLHIWGEHPCGATFTLTLSPDRLPPSCLVEPGRTSNEVNGVEVTAWAEQYDRDGDGETEYVCGSQFMAGDVGVRFENTGSPFGSEYGGQTDLEAGGAQRLNALLVGFALEGEGLNLDGVRTNSQIPAWEETEFTSLQQARSQTAFAPYLPQSAPVGYGDFYGRRSYQEGNYDMAWVRWNRGYDDVEVLVRYPENGELPRTVDVGRPQEYDLRLYSIPWSESVPEEYRESVAFPVFSRKDMSQEVVEARGHEKDTGGLAFAFGVLYPNGVLVEYRCDGLSAQAVWELVREALEASKF